MKSCIVGFWVMLALLVIFLPAAATTPAVICSAAGYGASGYYISDGLLSGNTCTVDAQCTSESNNPSWGYGNYTIYAWVSAANCQGGCGSSPCFYYVTQYDYEAPTPTPTPTPTPSGAGCTARCGHYFDCNGNIVCMFQSLSADLWYISMGLTGGTDVCDTNNGFMANWYGDLQTAYPCAEGDDGGENTTPVITAEPTWYFPPTTIPTYNPFPSPTDRHFVVPTGTIFPTQTIPGQNISIIPTLPTSLPDLPDFVNSTTVLTLICNTTYIGPYLCGPVSIVKTGFDWITSSVEYVLSILLSPITYSTDAVTYVFGLQNSLASGFLAGCTVYISVANQILGVFPVKIINMFTLFMIIDIVEQLITLPKVLRKGE